MPEQGDVAVDRPDSPYHPVNSHSQVFQTLALLGGMSPDRPVGDSLPHLPGGEPFEFTVIPFGQIGLDPGLRAKSGQFAGFLCPPQG